MCNVPGLIEPCISGLTTVPRRDINMIRRSSSSLAHQQFLLGIPPPTLFVPIFGQTLRSASFVFANTYIHVLLGTSSWPQAYILASFCGPIKVHNRPILEHSSLLAPFAVIPSSCLVQSSCVLPNKVCATAQMSDWQLVICRYVTIINRPVEIVGYKQ